MKAVLITFLLLLSAWPVLAQKNRIEFGTGGYRFFYVLEQGRGTPEFVSVSCGRIVHERISLYIRYSRLAINGYILTQERYGALKESEGKLTSRHEYNYLDLGLRCTVLHWGRHDVSALAGLSVAYGNNEYLKSAIWLKPSPGRPNGHPLYIFTEEKKEAYFGGLAGIRYDFHFRRNRINIGAEFAARQYANDFPFQVNYGLHTGFNF